MKKIVLKRTDKADILGSVSYDLVKTAITGQNLESLVKVYEYFKTTDTQIGSEIFKRRVYVCSLPLFYESEDKTQNEFISNYLENAKFKRLLFDMSSAIAYGFAPFLKQYKNDDGKILPDFKYIEPRYFNTDKDERLYLKQSFDRVFVDDDSELFWLHYHPTDSGDIITQSLMYRIVTIAALKHLVISKYMSYFDALSVPPLVINSDAVADENQSEAIIEAAVNLRANGVGLFGKDDLVNLINGNVDKGTFLDFIRYCDEAISKSITGQILAGNSQTNGTQALGRVHNEVRQDILRFDAGLMSASIKELVYAILSLNFSNVKPFKVALDAGLETDEELLSLVYERINNMGYEIPAEFMEQTFKIKGLKLKSNIQDKQSSVLQNNKLSFNNSIKSNLPLDKFDAVMQSKEYDNVETNTLKELENSLNEILKDSFTFEEAFKKLNELKTDIPLEKLEAYLINAIANSEMIGYED